jgi:hypothetical protein
MNMHMYDNERPWSRYAKLIGVAGLALLAAHGPLAWAASSQNLDHTRTALSSSLNPSAYGQRVTFTANVSGTQPGGAVTFMDGAAVLAQASLVKGAN